MGQKSSFLIITILSIGVLSAQEYPQNGLVGHWPFNGNANDVSGNNDHGKVVNAQLTTDRCGNPNSAYLFDGNSYIELDSTDYSSLSVSGWLKYSNIGYDTSTFFSKGFDNGYWLFQDRDFFHVNLNSTWDGVRHANAKDLNYHHIVITYDTVYTKIFIDGILIQDSIFARGDLLGNTYHKYLGAKWDSTYYHVGLRDTYFFKGIIDEFAMWNRALTAQEVLDIYNIGCSTASCQNTTTTDTATYFVTNSSFQSISPQLHYTSTDSLTTEDGNCDSVIVHYSEYVYEPISYTDTIVVYDTIQVAVYDSISVTDTLIIDVSLTGINPPNNISTIRVYPNPSKDFVMINIVAYAKMNGYKIEISNSVGQTVYNQLIDKAEFQIDVNDFGGIGMYFIKILDDQNTIMENRKLMLK